MASSSERVAAEVITNHRMARAPVWIERWSPEVTDGRREFFYLVVFSHHEVREVARAEGEGMRPEIGRPAAWKALDREAVERLVGARV